jgi:uncharacterized protein YcaQ
MVQTVSPALARRIALAAQGFGRRSAVTPGIRQLDALVNRLELLQIDSVNVFERSHYMPAFSRLGSYDKAQLDRLTTGREARFTEYWAHEASFLPLAAVRLADATLPRPGRPEPRGMVAEQPADARLAARGARREGSSAGQRH